MEQKKKKIDYITACAIAAEKMGMSYGKYMALGYRPEGFEHKTKKPEELEKTRVCPVCGKTFSMDGCNRNKVYCSEECQRRNGTARYMKKYRESRPTAVDRYCEFCGKLIPKERHRSSKTCSNTCSRELERVKRLEYDRERRVRKNESET